MCMCLRHKDDRKWTTEAATTTTTTATAATTANTISIMHNKSIAFIIQDIFLPLSLSLSLTHFLSKMSKRRTRMTETSCLHSLTLSIKRFLCVFFGLFFKGACARKLIFSICTTSRVHHPDNCKVLHVVPPDRYSSICDI